MLTWLFDLDDTLHDASPHIFPHINQSMTAYLQEHLALEEVAADALRSHYWRRYGATLLGLMRHHGTDPVHFLERTHQFPQLDRMVIAERAALSAVKKLPGRKILYSNAPAAYVSAVLGILRLDRCFDAVYAIEHLRYVPKPSLNAFRELLRIEHLNPVRTVMVDDTLANLHTAHRLGIRTIWVSRQAQCPAYVNLRVASVRKLGRVLDRLGLDRP